MNDLHMEVSVLTMHPNTKLVLDAHWPGWERSLNLTVHNYKLVVADAERDLVLSEGSAERIYAEMLLSKIGESVAKSSDIQMRFWTEDDH